MKTSTLHQALALLGMATLVPLALVATRGVSAAATGGDLRWAHAIESGEDHIGTKELAERMLLGDPTLLLIDVRPREEFDVWHLPGAVQSTVPDLLGEAGKKLLGDQKRTIVLYGSGPGHAGQAWVELEKRGMKNVRVLDGGIEAFKAEVLTPASLRGPATESQSKQAAGELALVRAFFLAGPDAKVDGAGRFATDPETLTKPTVVSARWAHEHRASVKFVDVREATDYAAWHVPGAVHLPQQKLRVKSGDRDLFLKPAAEIAEALGGLGIQETDPVVLCADDKLQDATLVALAFARVGHDKVAILEGGILGWASQRLPLAKDAPKPTKTTYHPRSDADTFTVTADALAKAVREGTTKVLDVRPPEFFRGEKTTEKRAGHIPGAVNRFFGNDFVRGDTGSYFKTPETLRADFEKLGLAKGTPVTVSCRTGHTASESFFVMRYLLGYENVRWFNGSWTEWASREDLPLETGEAKK